MSKIAVNKATSAKEKETVEIPCYKWYYSKFVKTHVLTEEKR